MPATDTLVGVLMMAYGGPNSLDEVAPYLADIRGGRPTSSELLHEISDRYRQIGGRSPILERTQAQAAAVQRALNNPAAQAAGLRFRTYVGMRHWRPYIDEVVPSMLADGVQRIIAIVMAPHYSRMSVGAYLGKLDKALAEQGASIPVTGITSWKDEPAFIAAVADRVSVAMAKFPVDARAELPVLFTAHSLPARILESNDPYPQELDTSVRLVVDGLGLASWRFAFQSQGASPEPWLGPTVEETLAKLAASRVRNVLLVPIGFVCDHVEVLYDVDIEHRQQAAELGMRLERIEMLNDDPGLVDAVASAVRRAALAAPAHAG